MGVEYRLLKMHKAESYDLGKARLPIRTETSPIRAIMNRARNHVEGVRRHDGPEPRSVWAIAQDGDDCTPVRLDLRWPDEARLANLLLVALNTAADPSGARAIAIDLLRWAGSDEVILVADNLDGASIALRKGTTVSNWMETGSAYTPGGTAEPDGREPR